MANKITSDTNDNDLIKSFQNGDMRALDVLMRRHRGIVWGVVRTHLGSITEAEDIFQDISLQLVQKPESYQLGSAKFSSWLFKVTTNRCLDILRSKASSAKHSELNEKIPNDLPSIEENISRYEIANQLLALLKELPNQQKMAISMYYYEDMDLPQISKMLSVSEGAARALIKRGRENLRSMDMNYMYAV